MNTYAQREEGPELVDIITSGSSASGAESKSKQVVKQGIKGVHPPSVCVKGRSRTDKVTCSQNVIVHFANQCWTPLPN